MLFTIATRRRLRPALPQILMTYRVAHFTGYEMDQVMKIPGKPDKPVPINWAYNHQ